MAGQTAPAAATTRGMGFLVLALVKAQTQQSQQIIDLCEVIAEMQGEISELQGLKPETALRPELTIVATCDKPRRSRKRPKLQLVPRAG